jgi:hypothetical protein
MSEPQRSKVIRLIDAQTGIPGPTGEHAAVVFRRGPLDIALSIPVHARRQSPHAQDEIYFIVRGRGVLFHDGRREPFQSGDLLFVWLQESSTKWRGSPRILSYGESFTALPVGRYPHSSIVKCPARMTAIQTLRTKDRVSVTLPDFRLASISNFSIGDNPPGTLILIARQC